MADSQEVPWIVPATIRNGNNVMRFHDASPRKLFLFPPANLAKTRVDLFNQRAVSLWLDSFLFWFGNPSAKAIASNAIFPAVVGKAWGQGELQEVV